MKKKIFLAIFAVLSLALITGCGSKNNNRVEIMDSLVGTWEYQLVGPWGDDTIKALKETVTLTFDKDYKFTAKSVVTLSNGVEFTQEDLTGTYGLNMEDSKILLAFDDKKKSNEETGELTYKFENGKFALYLDSKGSETFQKK